MSNELNINRRTEINYIDIETDKSASVFMEEIEDEYISPTEYPAHRHNFQEIFWIKSGHGTHRVDGELYEFAPFTLSLIGKGQVHKMEETFGTNGCYIRFTDDFLPYTSSEEVRRFTALFNPTSVVNTIHVPTAEVADLERLIELIISEYGHESMSGKFAVLRHLLMALLIRIEQFSHLNATQDAQKELTSYQLYQDFIQLLEENFRRQHEVSFYAKELHITANQLSRLLQQLIGRSAKRIILERILLEAKRYLQFTELSIKEVAVLLGYDDPYHFSKLFKQEQQLSPQAYREERQKFA